MSLLYGIFKSLKLSFTFVDQFLPVSTYNIISVSLSLLGKQGLWNLYLFCIWQSSLYHHDNKTASPWQQNCIIMATNSITLQQYNHDNDLHYHGNTITMTIKQHHHGISVTMVTLLFLFSLHVEIRQDNPSYRPWGRSEPGATVCVWKARRN